MKKLSYIRTKKELVKLYLNQYSEKCIRSYINDIIRAYRGEEKYYRVLSLQEIFTFIELYGLPRGYILSEELKTQFSTLKADDKILTKCV